MTQSIDYWLPESGERPSLVTQANSALVFNKPPGWVCGEGQTLHADCFDVWETEALHWRYPIDRFESGLCIAVPKSVFSGDALKKNEPRYRRDDLVVCIDKPATERGQILYRTDTGKDIRLVYETVQRGRGWTVIKVTRETPHHFCFLSALRSSGIVVMGDIKYGDRVDRRARRPLVHCSSLSVEGMGTFQVDYPADFAFWMGAPHEVARRLFVDNAETDVYRWYNGEADGTKGWIVDRYGSFAWVRHDEGQIEGPMPSAEGIYSVSAPKDRSRHENPGAVLVQGHPIPDWHWVVENGVRYCVKFEGERSTGMFLDQRPQRAWLTRFANNYEILNTFAHAGAFSVAASVAGAQTLSLDLSNKWLSRISRQVEENDGDPRLHRWSACDVFERLPRLARQGRKFDLVILDPPSTSIGTKKKRWSSVKHYSELVRLAAPLVKPGGLIWACTNHRQTLPSMFVKRVRAGLPKAFSLETCCPPAVDHPSLGPAPLKVHTWRHRG